MKSTFDDETYEDCPSDSPKFGRCTSTTSELISPEEVSVRKVEIYQAESWSDATITDGEVSILHDDVESLKLPPEEATSAKSYIESVKSPPGETDTVLSDTAVVNEPSEMYYTASSEVSLLSDTDPERVQEEEIEERTECVIAGHVAAMRERFESMTRANTPCPDLIRSMSPSLEVFRNITPSPDHLG